MDTSKPHKRPEWLVDDQKAAAKEVSEWPAWMKNLRTGLRVDSKTGQKIEKKEPVAST